jgi:D-serine deaminase-like pyridoxal phosphate-dependent protein
MSTPNLNSARADVLPTDRSLQDLQTPCLVLDEYRMTRNLQRLRRRLSSLSVAFRPHLKTHKSVEIARRMVSTSEGRAAVSTLREAEVFGAAGIRDLVYAVGIAPAKLRRVVELRREGVDLSVLLDTYEQAQAVIDMIAKSGERIPVFLEIDADGCRGGVAADDGALLQLGEMLHEGHADLRGVLCHAGGSYHLSARAELEKAAEGERASAVAAADALRDHGLPCSGVSVGSTPTAHFAKSLSGVTEVRAGVHVFCDLVMAGIGVCGLEDIAISVLATVIGHQSKKAMTFIDAGWTALSSDRGTATQVINQGYGVVCDVDGVPFPNLIVAEIYQEHGIVRSRNPSASPEIRLPVGSKVRILPNHACATAAQHPAYLVVKGNGSLTLEALWPRFGGW